MTPRVLVRRSSAVLALVLAAACGGDDSTGPKSTFTLAAPTTAVSVAAGGSTTITVPVTRSGSFTTPVSLTVEGAPAGVSASAVAVVAANSTLGQLFISVADTVTPRTINLTVRATAAGQSDQTVVVPVTVTARQMFAVTLPTRISIPQDGATTIKIPFTRLGGFGNVINLTVTGLPAGVTAPLTTVVGDTAFLTLTAAPAAGTGTSTTAATGTTVITLTAYNPLTGRTSPISQVDTLTVTAVPAYNLTVTPTSRTLVAPNTVQYSVKATRLNGFAGPIRITAAGLPNNVTADTTTITDSLGTVTVTGTSAALGTGQTIQIRGITAGLLDRNASVGLTVVGLLQNNVPLFALAGPINSFRYYRIVVPAGATNLTITTSGGTGDADIGVRFNALPTLGTGDACISGASGNAEGCSINNPTPGDWYVAINAFAAYDLLSLKAVVR